MAGEGSVEERLLLACQSGDTHTVQRLMSEVPGLDVGMAMEGVLLMHATIGTGEWSTSSTSVLAMMCMYIRVTLSSREEAPLPSYTM